MNKILTLIIDDEPLARERIRELLASDQEIRISGECDNGLDSVSLINEINPDLIFLDIQMPKLNGFEVLEKLEKNKIPEIIFVTAYDEFALKAFEVCAIDYLLKPFDKERFYNSLSKAKLHIKNKSTHLLNQNINTLLQKIDKQKSSEFIERFVIKNAGSIYFVDAEEVDWFEADGNYIKLHIGKKIELIRDTIKNIDEKLDPKSFVRVQRSAIVKIKSIKEIMTWFNNNYKIKLINGEEVIAGQKYRHNLTRLIK